MQNASEDFFAIAEHPKNGAIDESTSNHQEVDHTIRDSHHVHATNMVTVPSASSLDSTSPTSLKFDHPQSIVGQNTYYSPMEAPHDSRLGILSGFISGSNAFSGGTFNLFQFNGIDPSDVAKGILSAARLEK